MKRKELYNKTVDILAQAYFNDTLRHGNCYACACGNLVAANMGFKIKTTDTPNDWPMLDRYRQGLGWEGFPTYGKPGGINFGKITWLGIHTILCDESISENVRSQIESTGYTAKELLYIEQAFEKAASPFDAGMEEEDDRMFEGLMNVIDVLDKIHENTDKKVSQGAKQKFVKV